jgi:hypothetical protein
MSEIRTDQAQSQDIRKVAVTWNVAASVRETNPFAHVGYKLAQLDAIAMNPLLSGITLESYFSPTAYLRRSSKRS